MKKQNIIPSISIRAKTHYEFGYAYGRKLARQVHDRLLANRAMYKDLGAHFPSMVKDAKRFIPAVKQKFPELLQEVRGMADGASVPFAHLFAINCEEELLDYFIPHCTSVAVQTKSGDLLIGHNEDWLQSYNQNGLVVVRGQIGKESFLALSFMAQLVGTSCALNSHGLGYTVNSLNFKRFRYGLPRNFILRNVLQKKTLREAEHVVLTPRRALCANTLFVWRNMQMEDIESLYRHAETYHGNRWLIHTNHPLRHHDEDTKNTARESVRRYKRVQEILSDTHSAGINTLKKILRDHPVGICGHIEARHPTYGATIASVIMNPLKGWMLVAHSNPCKNQYYRYTL